jgi:hypothetical protein
MENWCYDKPTVDGFARHYQTGEALPNVCMCVCAVVCMCLRFFIYIYIYIYIYVGGVCVSVCVCMYVCMYVWVVVEEGRKGKGRGASRYLCVNLIINYNAIGKQCTVSLFTTV